MKPSPKKAKPTRKNSTENTGKTPERGSYHTPINQPAVTKQNVKSNPHKKY